MMAAKPATAEAAAAAVKSAETAAMKTAEAGMSAGKAAYAARPAIGVRPIAVEAATAKAMAKAAMIEIAAAAVKPIIPTEGQRAEAQKP